MYAGLIGTSSKSRSRARREQAQNVDRPTRKPKKNKDTEDTPPPASRGTRLTRSYTVYYFGPNGPVAYSAFRPDNIIGEPDYPVTTRRLGPEPTEIINDGLADSVFAQQPGVQDGADFYAGEEDTFLEGVAREYARLRGERAAEEAAANFKPDPAFLLRERNEEARRRAMEEDRIFHIQYAKLMARSRYVDEVYRLAEESGLLDHEGNPIIEDEDMGGDEEMEDEDEEGSVEFVQGSSGSGE